MSDINLLYHGGSGGFFCLHLLLLTGKYNCIFDGYHEYADVYKQQWNIKNMPNWKQSEIWPNNRFLLESELESKLFFHCNNPYYQYNNYPGAKILLYTDFTTQYYMTRTKRALWFNGDDIFSKEKYDIIKGRDWPDCKNAEDFKKLPKWIQHECVEEFNFNSALLMNSEYDYKIYSDGIKKTIFNGIEVYYKVKEITDQGIDIAVRLQDLIKTKGKVLFDQLSITGNQQTDDFVDMYVNLHTPEQKKLLLK